MKNKKGFLKRIVVIVIALAFVIGAFTIPVTEPAGAAGNIRKITLQQAQALAIYNSANIEKMDMQLEAKRASLKSAIKSIKVKKKNLSTFRWSPLLKFKFPQSPDMAEALEFQLKPIQIQYDIDKLEHTKNDARFTETEAVNNLFLDIVTLQQQIDFYNGRLGVLERSIAETQSKVYTGEASQKDLDSMKASRDKLTQSMITAERNLLKKKEKLSNKIKLDVTSRYDFQNPMVENTLTLDMKDQLIQYAKDRDDIYYQACVDETLARVTMETNYALLNSFYSRKYMRMISPYIDAVLRGEEINQREFTRNYQDFVERVNEKWKGKKRILFFKFPKNWTQGTLDGDRYIEDDPMSMLTAVNEYLSAKTAREQAEADLINNIDDALTSYIDVRNSYESIMKTVEKDKVDLEKATIANKSGAMDYSSFKAVSDKYEEDQMTLLETAKLYSQTMYSLDRLTCGALTALFKDLTVDLSEAPGGESYVEEEYIKGATYYIRPIIYQTQFQLGINIPDDFDLEVTDFELWVNGTMIGERTPVDKTIRHMAFNFDSVTDSFIRFYNGEDFVDDVEIDTGVYSGELEIVKDLKVVDQTRVIAKLDIVESQDFRPSSMKITMTAPEAVSFYKIKDYKGTYLLNGEMRKITDEFIYHDFIRSSLGSLIFEFYDDNQSLVFNGRANPVTREIMLEKEEDSQ